MALLKEPLPRRDCFSIAILSDACVWGGYLGSRHYRDRLSILDVFDSCEGYWYKKQTFGKPPDGFYGGSCTLLGSCLYLYGGWDSYDFIRGGLSELNIKTLVWRRLSVDGARGPLKKFGSGMAAYGIDSLVLFGGRSNLCPIGIPDEFKGYSEYTNELHFFNIASGESENFNVLGVI